jgi:hypothetical protein
MKKEEALGANAPSRLFIDTTLRDPSAQHMCPLSITMPRNVNDVIDKLSPAQRRKVEKRAAALLAEELSLRELRRAHKLTQVKLARSLGVRQEQISRLEQRSDLLISTLRGYVEAMGGRLSLVAEFPNRKPVTLSGIAEMD